MTKLLSLQQQCLHFLAENLEDSSSETVSLLPAALRGRVLLSLPAVDVCRLEENEGLTKGVNLDDVWRALIQDRIIAPKGGEAYFVGLKEQPKPKDTYLNHVFRSILLDRYSLQILPTQDYSDFIKMGKETEAMVIAYLLYGIRVENEELELRSFQKFTLFGLSWITPQRYAKRLAQMELLPLISQFLQDCKWYPTQIHLDDGRKWNEILCDMFGSPNSIFKSLTSRVEEVTIDGDDYSNYEFARNTTPLWEALACSKLKCFKTLSITACVTILPDLIESLVEGLYCNNPPNADVEEDLSCGYTDLKRITIIGHDEGTHPQERGVTAYFSSAMEDLAKILDNQNSLEVLVLEDFMNLVQSEDEERRDMGFSDSCHEGFEYFFNYLPSIIARPSLKSLRIASCLLPLNAVKSMVFTFLSKPTSCDQMLDLGDCSVVDECYDTLENRQLIKPIQSPCVCGSFKSLSLPLSGQLCSPDWILGYPNLRLKRLELDYKDTKFLSLYDSLKAHSQGSTQLVCVHFQSVPHEAFKSIDNILYLPCVVEAGFTQCQEQKNGPLSFLGRVLSSPTVPVSLRKLYFHQLQFIIGYVEFVAEDYLSEVARPYYTSSAPIGIFHTFFQALFSLPSQQLAEFTLEFSKTDFTLDHFQALVTAWKTKAHGQKLKLFKYSAKSPNGIWSGYNSSTLYDLVGGIALEVKLELICR